MKRADVFLIVIVLGVVVLVFVTFSIALFRPKAGYLSEDTPEEIANNYFYALQQADYERAYRYLSPTMKFYPPSAQRFRENIENDRYSRNRMNREDSPSLHIDAVRMTGDRAIVTVRQTYFYRRGMFSSNQYETTFEMVLVKSENSWKILFADYYNAWCWGIRSYCQ